MKKLFPLILCLLATPALAQTPDAVGQPVVLTYAPVVKKTAPAVVNIYTKRKVVERQAVSPLLMDPFFRQFFGNNMPSGGTRERIVISLGSGVIIDPKGIIVTSYHVIKDADKVTLALSDRSEFEAELLKADPQTDLAFLTIKPKIPLPFIEMRDSDTLEVGDVVLALGNPFGVGQTVTHGIISALARNTAGASDYKFFIQTDAPINPGNSGGALVDMQGRLIGINTAIYSTSGASVGIGFAIPANMVKSVLESKVQDGHVVRAWLGVGVQTVTADIADSLGMKKPQGVIVRDISNDSPAQRAGLKEGDIILSINGNETNNESALQYRIGTAAVGETLELMVMQGGAMKPLTVTLVSAPQQQVKAVTLTGKHPLSGVSVTELTPKVVQDLGLKPGAKGVLVLAQAPSSLLGNALQPGDVILQVNGKAAETVAQLQKLLESAKNSWQISFQRGASVLTLTIKL